MQSARNFVRLERRVLRWPVDCTTDSFTLPTVDSLARLRPMLKVECRSEIQYTNDGGNKRNHVLPEIPENLRHQHITAYASTTSQ